MESAALRELLEALSEDRFCKDKCRKEFHRYGAAYGPLKDKLEKFIELKVKERTKALTEELALQRGILENLAPLLPENEIFRQSLANAGFIHRSQLGRLVRKVRAMWATFEIVPKKENR